jgi:hypothetical protein
MDVYLLPVGPERYELYCEVPDDVEEADPAGDQPQGYWRRMVHRFREMIAEAERERRHGTPHGVSRGWFGRVRARTLRWVAESIAEQRLLWHLRKQDGASLHYPDDLPADEASAIVRAHLKRDFEKHRFWLAIESVLFVASGVLMLVPGPNLIAYYLAFRIVGHFLSLRGANRGLAIAWRCQPSAPLTELRRLLSLAPDAREPRVHAVAQTLRLEHLVSFFERTAVSA